MFKHMIAKARKLFGFLCLGLLLFALISYGEEKKADLYAPAYAQPLSPEPLKGIFSRIIEFPFKLIKWPIDRGIIYTEQHRLDKKSIWLYEESLTAWIFFSLRVSMTWRLWMSGPSVYMGFFVLLASSSALSMAFFTPGQKPAVEATVIWGFADI